MMITLHLKAVLLTDRGKRAKQACKAGVPFRVPFLEAFKLVTT